MKSAAFLISLLTLVLHSASSQDVEMEAHNWASRNYERVLNLVLPAESDQLDFREVEWSVRLRIRPAWEPEMACTLVKRWNGAVNASITILLSRSVHNQLKSLYRRNKNSSVGTLSSLINRKTYDLTVERCPALRNVSEAFEKLEIPANQAGGLQMDPTGYDLFSRGLTGTMRLSIAAPDPEQVVDWAERLRKAVVACAPH